MEKLTQEYQGELTTAENSLASNHYNRGCLAKCGDMDRQLVQVATAKFSDMHFGLLDEFFQCVYFSDLLGYRR